MTLRSQVRRRARFDLLRYAQVWEDPRVLRRGLRVMPGQNVFSIAAAGDNALALLLDDPGHVVALDMSPVQLSLVHLKVAALRVLEPDDVLRLLGEHDCAHRSALYRHLRPSLPEDARGYWDAHEDAIDAGVIHTGKFEGYFHLFRRLILPLTQSEETVAQLLASPDLVAQRRLFEGRWDNRRWRGLFRLFFGKTLLGRLGRDPAFFKFVDEEDVGQSFLGRAEHGIADVPIVDNFFAEYILTGRHSGRHGLPPYLEPDNQRILKDRLERLEVREGDMESYFSHPDAIRFDAYNLSDCFEWMSAQASEQLLRALLASARPGARFCYWNLLVPRRRPDALAGVLEGDEALAAELHAIDRTFFYRDFVVETFVGKTARVFEHASAEDST